MVEMLIRSVCGIRSTEPKEDLRGVFVRARGEEGCKERGEKRKRGGFEGVVAESCKERKSGGEIREGGEEGRERTEGGVGRREEKGGT